MNAIEINEKCLHEGIGDVRGETWRGYGLVAHKVVRQITWSKGVQRMWENAIVRPVLIHRRTLYFLSGSVGNNVANFMPFHLFNHLFYPSLCPLSLFSSI